MYHLQINLLFGANHTISIYRDLPHTLTVSADPHHARVLIAHVEQRDVFEKIDAHIFHTRKDGFYELTKHVVMISISLLRSLISLARIT